MLLSQGSRTVRGFVMKEFLLQIMQEEDWKVRQVLQVWQPPLPPLQNLRTQWHWKMTVKQAAPGGWTAYRWRGLVPAHADTRPDG